MSKLVKIAEEQIISSVTAAIKANIAPTVPQIIVNSSVINSTTIDTTIKIPHSSNVKWKSEIPSIIDKTFKNIIIPPSISVF